jgi:predicted amidophosphoribosyltransferase
MRPGGDRLVGGRLVVRSAWRHEGPARALVHRLKYEGLVTAAGPLARPLAGALPPETRALVPVPRAVWRRVRLGVDPAVELARALSGLTGIPVVPALRPPLTARRHAGRDRISRAAPVFGRRAAFPEGAVLVDDVLTTGMTLTGAMAAIGGRAALAVTGTAADGGH